MSPITPYGRNMILVKNCRFDRTPPTADKFSLFFFLCKFHFSLFTFFSGFTLPGFHFFFSKVQQIGLELRPVRIVPTCTHRSVVSWRRSLAERCPRPPSRNKRFGFTPFSFRSCQFPGQRVSGGKIKSELCRVRR